MQTMRATSEYHPSKSIRVFGPSLAAKAQALLNYNMSQILRKHNCEQALSCKMSERRTTTGAVSLKSFHFFRELFLSSPLCVWGTGLGWTVFSSTRKMICWAWVKLS